MTTHGRALAVSGLAALAFAAAAHAQPLRIDGISPFEPLPGAAVTPVVAAHRMEIRWQDGRLLRVTPWPAFLPQHFGRQTVEASRKMFPAGPTDRLSFVRRSDQQCWLVVGNGARAATELVGAWRLQRAGNGWTVSDGSRFKQWNSAAPVRVPAGRDHWCLYLLDAGRPQQQAGIATEGEPQIAWAAQRLDARRNRCPARR